MVPHEKSARQATLLSKLRVQVFCTILLSCVLPLALVQFQLEYIANVVTISVVASGLAALTALLVFRRMTAFPGIAGYSVILPAYCVTYGIAVAAFFFTRSDYSRPMLFVGFAASTSFAFLLTLFLERRAVQRFYIVPGGRVATLSSLGHVIFVALREPVLPPGREAIVADLHHDHAPEWERMLAEAALLGRPVYHIKQLQESLTGRVAIEHLSENSWGSLLPNMAYGKIKRLFDLAGALILLPLLAPLMVMTAIAIRLDSPGPALFRQQRMGYRARPFTIYKFRSMRVAEPCDAARTSAMTLADDARVTRIGRIIRRTRIDELPQLINVLTGEMSMIGPRPEALALSQWYEQELPFYSYRHVVRPGITGWAQVNQGHVAELDDVRHKLQYEFYYIKNYSAWLDIVITVQTLMVVLTGYGAR
ncbi:exopolysaccharide biosynthesis polyprenyl glycosylphosphotransferase [Sphingomonas immobilis]|uniref:exopolysaccharide biosynthesis polyprenyl glycosylphosphotransferase n=1 Tax=Sphingomonas immobilis TaxID=3063997 RepID=UPI00272A5C0D|nr:exopolysaccharide biosynthesis polyprenyl glycosylphosphotransferase [Sphingomonas sp. CA1-15]